ncbi:cell envelope integrity protein CreD [Rhizobacter sp. Root1221]|uniref:cell envelope integrity protein CreD n=1 Tax=Rhizobacter sp. Root1221 TaxID=1736433 RepID=UPI0006F77620|nr:cell envelope integrity protein CreD [Rhizobacter sp. Root1221]KQV99519.1 hypothetical protein ASC87_02110 [Rhizobacter sp. Root1221]
MKLNPTLIKVLTLLAIVGLLMLALARVGGLVDERQQRASEARRSIEQAQAGPQALLGPVLRAVCHETWETVERKGNTMVTSTLRREFFTDATPDRLDIVGNVVMEARYRGLFKVNTYVTDTTLSAQWKPLQPEAENPKGRVTCGSPTLAVALSDSRGLREAHVQIDGQEVAVLPGTPFKKLPSGFHAVVPRTVADTITAKVKLQIVGTGDLAIAPVGDNNQVALTANWGHPSFGGRFLPVQRDVEEGKFTAHWRISALASSADRDFFAGRALCTGVSAADKDNNRYSSNDDTVVTAAATASDGPSAPGCIETFGVDFIDPVNAYSLSDRALKYGLLFIALSFVAVGMVEVLRRLRVHPVQYLLVGCALSVFFLLLLSLSEHLAFGISYAVAATACVSLLAFYATHVLGGWRAGLLFGTGIAGLYGALYLLLQMEQTAMVLGSVLLFLVLAAVMVLTRRVDWYGLIRSTTPAA